VGEDVERESDMKYVGIYWALFAPMMEKTGWKAKE